MSENERSILDQAKIGLLVCLFLTLVCGFLRLLPPLVFGVAFLVWLGITFALKSKSEEALQYWGYGLVIPGAIVTGLWTMLDLWRSIEGVSALVFLPQSQLYLWSAFWVLFPPMFFFMEFHVLFKTCAGDDDTFARLKHQQHLAAAVWVAFVTVIGGASIQDWVKELQDKGSANSLERRIEALEERVPSGSPR